MVTPFARQKPSVSANNNSDWKIDAGSFQFVTPLFPLIVIGFWSARHALWMATRRVSHRREFRLAIAQVFGTIKLGYKTDLR